MMGQILMTFRKKLREDPTLFQRFKNKLSPYPPKGHADTKIPQWNTPHHEMPKWTPPHYGKPKWTPDRTEKSQWITPHSNMSKWIPPYTDQPRWTPRKHSTWATRDHQPRCYRCGETGHVQDLCRHLKDVFCWTCNQQGHKQKHCNTLTSRPRHQH